MSRFAANAYRKVDVETSVAIADPHQMILMLYDGALETMALAANHLREGRIQDKGRALSKAARIVDEGLKASVDRDAGGDFAQRLIALYQYITGCLLKANLRNDLKPLEEAQRLLGGLRNAWAQIGPKAQQGAPAAAGERKPDVAPPARRAPLSAAA